MKNGPTKWCRQMVLTNRKYPNQMNRIFASKANKIPEHPGVIIERAMKDHAMTPISFSKAVGISKMQLDDLFKQKISINRALAGKLGSYFGNGSGAWLKMQALWDEREV